MEKKQDNQEKKLDIGVLISTLKGNPSELPSWEDELKGQYYPHLHPVMDKTQYPDKLGKHGRNIKVTRATRGLQRRAVKTMAGMMFGIPVERIYTFSTPDNEQEIKASKIIERILERNRIDAVNIQRSIQLFACCQIATLWYAVKEQHILYGEPSPLKLKCRHFSPMQGEKIFPMMDEYGDMIALSFEYIRKENGVSVTYFDTYSATEHIKWKNQEGAWLELERESIAVIGKIPAIYTERNSPIWEDSNNVTEIEWAYSRNGNYLRKNSVPVYEIRENQDTKIQFQQENDDDERVILRLSDKGSSGYKTWEQAVESLKFQTEGLERSFFSDIQLPNLSFDEMKGMASSGESKRYMFMDAHIKVLEEQGAWLTFFDREINIIKAFAKLMYPSLAGSFDNLQVKSLITPFSMNEEKDKIANATTATGGKAIASRKTAIKRLGWVEDVDLEMEQIEQDEEDNTSETAS